MSTTTTTITALIDLADRYGRHLDWAVFADGCDWCCGGGNEEGDELNAARDELGFDTWGGFLRSLLDALGHYEGMEVFVTNDFQWFHEHDAGGGYSLHKGLKELPGWTIAVWDRSPWEGREDENGNWCYTHVALIRNPPRNAGE